MENILADLTSHAQSFQAHADVAKSSEASQKDKENAFFLAQVQFAGMQQKFGEIVHHVDLELTDILKGFGIDWIKKNTKPEEKKEYVETPETSEPVAKVSQPQFLGDVPSTAQETTTTTEVVPTQETTVQEPTPATQEQEGQQTTS